MRVIAALMPILLLAACAEVTSFRRPDGSVYHYLDCESGLRLFESCGAAARRTCPSGYTRVNLDVTNTQSTDPAYARCLEENGDRDDGRKPESLCSRAQRREGYFQCK